MLWPFNKYPGTDYETFNWEWILKTVKRWNEWLTAFKNDFSDALYETALKIAVDHPEWFSFLPFVCPEMYDTFSENDSTEAIQNAIDNVEGKYVLLRDKTYKITDTLTMGEGTEIRGIGSATIEWDSELAGTMIRVYSLFNKPATLRNIVYTVNDAGTVIEINNNRWGVCAKVRDVRIHGGKGPIIKMMSAFNCEFDNVQLFTEGYVLMAPWDNTEPWYDTFCNENSFKNCYYSGAPEDSTKAFRMRNTKNTLFDTCSIEKCALAFDMDSTAERTMCINGWFEHVDEIYKGVNYLNIENCHLTNCQRLNGSGDAVTQYIKQGTRQLVLYEGDETGSFTAFYNSNPYIDKTLTGYNDNTGHYAQLYERSTKYETVRVPRNIRIIKMTNGQTEGSIDLDTFFNDESVAALYKATGVMYYPDSSSLFFNHKRFELNKANAWDTGVDITYRDTWGTAANATVEVSMAANTLIETFTTSAPVKFGYVIIETLPLGSPLSVSGS